MLLSYKSFDFSIYIPLIFTYPQIFPQAIS